MDVLTSAFTLVHDHPGGASALARVLGKNAATLSHEVSPNYPTAKLGLVDAVALSVHTRDPRILNAFASRMGCMVVPLPEASGDLDSFQAVAAAARAFGELAASVADAVADGSVSANELREVEAEAGELMAAVQCTLSRVAAMHATASPRGRALELIAEGA